MNTNYVWIPYHDWNGKTTQIDARLRSLSSNQADQRELDLYTLEDPEHLLTKEEVDEVCRVWHSGGVYIHPGDKANFASIVIPRMCMIVEAITRLGWNIGG